MKSAASVALIGALVGSLVPVAAQGRTEPTAGPIARRRAQQPPTGHRRAE
jgi:hypothetical protein